MCLNLRIPESTDFRINLDEGDGKCLRNTSTYVLYDVNQTEASQLSRNKLLLASCTSASLSLTFL